MQALSTKITPFDALKYIGILTKKGFSKDQATALLEAQKSASSDMMQNTLVTKNDVMLLNNDLFLIKNDTIFLKNEMEILTKRTHKLEHNGLEMKHQINQYAFEFKERFEAMQAQINTLATKSDVESLEKKFQYEISHLETRFDGKFRLLHWMLGFILTGMIGILLKLFQF